MFKKYLSNESGFTLLEVLATLVISSILIGITYGVLTTTVTFNEKSTSHIDLRQEANIIITQLRQKHQEEESEYPLCVEDLLSSGLSFVKIDLINNTNEINSCDEVNPEEALHVNFILSNQSYRFEIDTVIEGRRTGEKIEFPEHEYTFEDFLRDENVLFYGNVFDFTGNGLVIGPEATVVMRNGFSSNSGSKTAVQAKNIYIQGEVDLKHISLGNPTEPLSTIYIDGNIKVENLNQVDVYGSLKHTGTITGGTLPHTTSYSVKQVNSIDFPEYTIPDVRDHEWYISRNYTEVIQNNTYRKILLNDTNDGYTHANYASRGNINIRSNTKGILFAPDGEVTIDNNATFIGIIIANSIDIKGKVVYAPPPPDAELPF
ncbi:type II secretion system protein J [Alkalihalophilus sp. As8PL]|uniref:Type II secretion system protein J n=1 Tax=Alkalihalophilus sp. As8PL TaxID=3237103 RepID=A0AB39BQB1_9BACI